MSTSELQVKELAYKSLSIEDEDSVSAYYRIRQQLDVLGKELKHFILKPTYLLPFLQPGRVVKVGRNASKYLMRLDLRQMSWFLLFN